MRFIVLDIIRCAAIILLIIAHIAQVFHSPVGGYFGIPNFYRVTLGGFAVTIFLILSGFVLQLRYGQNKITYNQFILKRILRIYPIYYMSLFLGIFVYFVKNRLLETDNINILFSFSNFSIVDILCSVTGCYAFVGKWGGLFVATSWYIGLIMAMYLCFPLLSKYIIQSPLRTIFLLFLITVMSRLILGQFEILPKRPLDWFPLCRTFEFGLGIYLADIINFNKKTEYNYILLSAISFVSNISFPLFLVHYPLLFIIKYRNLLGFNEVTSIALFLALSVLISHIFLFIDNKIPKKLHLSS